jgi:hypothetical protein
MQSRLLKIVLIAFLVLVTPTVAVARDDGAKAGKSHDLMAGSGGRTHPRKAARSHHRPHVTPDRETLGK